MRNVIQLIPKLAPFASILIFAACLLNDGYYLEGHDPRAWAPAWVVLLVGWFGIASGTLAWFANPLLALAWTLSLSRKHSFALGASVVALVLMITFLFQTTVISSTRPDYSRIIGYGLGYWLWLGSAAVQAIGSAVELLSRDVELSKNDV